MSKVTDSILRRVRRALDDGVAQAAVDFQTAVRAKLSQHDSSLSSGLVAAPMHEPPGQRTGTLLRSFNKIHNVGTPDHPARLVGTNVIYARQLEYGGPIHAKRTKYLLIPLGPDGYTYLRNAGGNIRNDKTLRFVVRKGNLFIVRDVAGGEKLGKGFKKQKDARVLFLFILKKSVYQHPHPYFKPAWEETAHARAKTLREAMIKGLKSLRTK